MEQQLVISLLISVKFSPMDNIRLSPYIPVCVGAPFWVLDLSVSCHQILNHSGCLSQQPSCPTCPWWLAELLFLHPNPLHIEHLIPVENQCFSWETTVQLGTKRLEDLHKAHIFNLNFSKQVKTVSNTSLPPYNAAPDLNSSFQRWMGGESIKKLSHC